MIDCKNYHIFFPIAVSMTYYNIIYQFFPSRGTSTLESRFGHVTCFSQEMLANIKQTEAWKAFKHLSLSFLVVLGNLRTPCE